MSKIKTGLIVLATILINLSLAGGQEKKPQNIELPVLTTNQMFSDFDKFVETVKDFSPQTPVRKKVTGIDAVAELKKMRSRIPHIKTTAEFAFLIQAAITVLQDGHSSLIRANYLPANDMKELGISDPALELLPLYDNLLRIVPQGEKKFNLQLKYIDGVYYNIAPFTHQNLQFKSGLRLVEINGQKVHSFIGRLYPFCRMMRWDFVHRRYYSENFYQANNLSGSNSLKLKFADNSGKTKEAVFKLSEALVFENNTGVKINSTKKVEYFSDQQLLYIRLPKMDLEDADFYPAEIKGRAANQPLKKVIIDIRDNPGGSDNVWLNILAAIINKPVIYNNFILCNPSAGMKKKFSEEAAGWKSYRAPFLDNYDYAVFASGETQVTPAPDSINFDGKIYILQNDNIYSSAGSLAAVGVLAENMFTVGQNTGRLLGRGISPLLFELPHSRIIYRIEPVIDFLNVRKAADIYHDQVEIPVSMTIEQYLERLNFEGDVYSREFLSNHDPVFLKAAETAIAP